MLGVQAELGKAPARVRVHAPEDRLPVLRVNGPKRLDHGCKPLVLVDRLGAVQRREEVLAWRDAQAGVDAAGRDLLLEVREHFEDRIARDRDPVAGNPFPEQVLPASLRVGQQDGAGVVDDPAVDLLRHSVVVAAVAGFHVVDGNAEAFRHDRGQAAVRVAEDKEAVRLLGEHHAFGAGQDRADLLTEAAAGAELVVGSSDAELGEEDVAQVCVVVLPRVDDHLVTHLVQPPHDETQADDLRACAQDRHDPHGASPDRRGVCLAISAIISATDGGVAYPAAAQSIVFASACSVRRVRSTGCGACAGTTVMSSLP
jgi:hypothetical protein